MFTNLIFVEEPPITNLTLSKRDNSTFAQKNQHIKLEPHIHKGVGAFIPASTVRHFSTLKESVLARRHSRPSTLFATASSLLKEEIHTKLSFSTILLFR